MKPSIINRVLRPASIAAGIGWIVFSGYMMFAPIWSHRGAISNRNVWVASGHLNYSVHSASGTVIGTVSTTYWVSILVAVAFVVAGFSGLKKGSRDRA
jgi:hypothetical protein